MSLKDYRTLGKSGLRVSPFCLGTMTFGKQWGWGSEDEEATAVLETYLEQGGNFLDTANVYTKGYSESFIGKYFASRKNSVTNSARDRVVIATKFMGNLYRDDPNGGGGGRKSIIAACEHSLRRLQTDYIDLYWAHFWDRHTPIEETIRAMDDLVTSGKVRYIGLSDHPAWVCAHAQSFLREIKGSPLIALQIEYGLAQRTVEAELVPMAEHFDMGITPWSPLRGGVLSGKYRRSEKHPEGTRIQEDGVHLTEKNFDIIEELYSVADEITHVDGEKATPAQVALCWVQSRSTVSSTIVGARNVAQFNDNLRALEITLTPDQEERLDRVSAVTHPFPYDFVLNSQKMLIQGGVTVNGLKSDYWDLSPVDDNDRY